ncbi:ribonuclease HIII [Streptococcus macacae]|nr:ribonuclease HIII [Streptococcus macacae]
METFVVKLDEKAISSLEEKLKRHQVQNANAYVRFAAKVKQVTVLIYSSNKVVFQGNAAQQLAQQMGVLPKKQNQTAPSKSQKKEKSSVLGTDEVGNGSYFGGLAVVASFVTPHEHDFLKEMGIDDSKNLTDTKIRQLAPLLEEKIPHRSLLLTPKKYNQVVGKGLKHNAVSVKVALHNQAIFLLLKDGIKPDKIVIDAFTSPKNYDRYLQNEKNRFSSPISLEEKAEGKYLAVAVSSIIARSLFLENLEHLSREIGFQLPSGAGRQSDKAASQILKVYGKSGLELTAKWHFKNTEKAYHLLKK